MQWKYFSRLGLFFTIIGPSVFCSCNKPADDTITNGIKDSSLLIKSITSIISGRDSVTEYYSYDSANRKIKIHWSYDNNYPKYSLGLKSTELTYNSSLLLSHISYNYKSHNSDDRTGVDIEYDPERVLKKITIKYFNGKNSTNIFYKTKLDGGKYQMDWTEHYMLNDVADSTVFRYLYDNEGKCLSSYFSYSSPGAYDYNENILYYTLHMVTHKYIYDTEGNLGKIESNVIDTFSQINETYTSVEFSGRQSKGNELYNHRQALLNGIANIPEVTNSSHATFIDIAGILSWFPWEFESQSFEKFPYTTAKSTNFSSKKDFNSNGVSEYDDKGRLVRFSGSLYGKDFAWRINYFK